MRFFFSLLRLEVNLELFLSQPLQKFIAHFLIYLTLVEMNCHLNPHLCFRFYLQAKWFSHENFKIGTRERKSEHWSGKVIDKIEHGREFEWNLFNLILRITPSNYYFAYFPSIIPILPNVDQLNLENDRVRTDDK